MSDRINWVEGKYSETSGFVGRHRLFSISWKTRRTAPDWTLDVLLPGSGQSIESSDKDALKAEAEELLEHFVASLGAVFPESGSLPGGSQWA